MIEWMKFNNFRVLRDALLPLGPLTVIIGPNGSGKSTALKAFDTIHHHGHSANLFASVGMQPGMAPTITVKLPDGAAVFELGRRIEGRLESYFRNARVYSLDADAIAKPVQLERIFELQPGGAGLASVLTNLQDQFPERFDLLNDELRRWLPEFDRVLFDTPSAGSRAFMLRTADGAHPIPASQLSQGTILALALLTLAHLPNPPSLVGLEEPDRGIHPRLLRDVQDALFRLTDPVSFGDSRAPVQVIVTTHSPYLVDLFRDHPESIVIAEKDGLFANFKRLIDLPNFEEILRDAHLGEAWYSGVLGGVPSGT